MNKAPAISKVVSFSDGADDVIMDFALMYNETYSENLLSFVNNIKTPDGGTHEAGNCPIEACSSQVLSSQCP